MFQVQNRIFIYFYFEQFNVMDIQNTIQKNNNNLSIENAFFTALVTNK